MPRGSVNGGYFDAEQGWVWADLKVGSFAINQFARRQGKTNATC
jgi:hypothetical protein